MADRKPVIGISNCSKMADYEESVRVAGGEPLVLDWNAMTPDAALAAVDGLVMTGGPDVDPRHYREERHENARLAPAARDEFEVELVRGAVARDIPMLAICRGMQVLNVAIGGTLTQDIPTELPGSGPHSLDEPKNAIAHPVRIAPGSRLAALLGRDKADVNSRHHQAIKRAAPGLIVTATAPDDIVEALEKPDARFCVAVEWHPENFVETGEFEGLFRGLVLAASETQRAGRR